MKELCATLSSRYARFALRVSKEKMDVFVILAGCTCSGKITGAMSLSESMATTEPSGPTMGKWW